MPNALTSPHTLLDLVADRSPNTFTPKRAMLWYDSIADDMLANPGTSIKDIAARLGRSPVTISYVVNSDLFRARYAQRREYFNSELDNRLTKKLVAVAELSLDLTREKLESSRTGVPLPLLHDITTKSLEKLGYGVKPASPAVQVNVQNNTSSTSVAIPASVSADALEEARAMLRRAEQAKLLPGPTTVPASPAERPDAVVESGGTEEDLL